MIANPSGLRPALVQLLGPVVLVTACSLVSGCRVASPQCEPEWFDEEPVWLVPEVHRHDPQEGVWVRRFNTGEGLLAAQELLLSGPPFLARYEELEITRTLLDEVALEKNAYWYARYNLDTAFLTSGAGLHLMHGPSLRNPYQRHADAWKSPQEGLDVRLEQFRRRTGVENMPYLNMFPIYLEYESSDPFYTRAPLVGDPTTGEPADAQTLLFDPRQFEETFSLASLGQALKAQTEYAAFCFRSTRPQNDGAARPLLGATPEEGYLGAILLEAAASKIQTLADFLSYDTVTSTLGPAPLDGYDPTLGVVFFPSRFRAIHDRLEVIGQTPLPPRAIAFDVVDDPIKSRLADQAWLLLALSRFVEATDPDGSLARQGVFGDERSGALFPFHYHGLAGALARTVAKNLLHLHWDKKNRTLISTVLVKGEVQGALVHTEDASLAILAMGAYIDTLSDGDSLGTALLSVMGAQASYLLEIQQYDGSYPEAVEAGTTLVCRPVVWPLAAQSLAISAHLEVYRKLLDPVHKMAALRTYEFMKEELWALDVQLFKTEEVTNGGVKYIVYAPYVYAVTLAALRNLVEATCSQPFADNHREFIEGLPHTRLLLSELQPTEDPLSPLDPVPDPDGDGIPFAPLACPPHGAAPVFAARTILKVP